MDDTTRNNVDMICRQTTYTVTEAEKKLEEHNNNVFEVIKEFLGVEKKETKTKSVNQQIYQQIGKFMDGVHEQYDKRSNASLQN